MREADGVCRPLTRREMLRFAALAAATPLAVRYAMPARAFAQVPSRAVPMHLELVTLTDTSAVLTWFTGDPSSPDEYGRPDPIPADTVVMLGTLPAALQTVVDIDVETPYHYVELTGLEPGRSYYYVAMSNGIAATPSTLNLAPGTAVEPAATGTFTTPLPPPGRHLFTMAWANDLHIGELTSGLAYSDDRLPGGGFPPGYPVDPTAPYWKVMTEAAVAESKARGAELLVLNGDLTSEAEPPEVELAKSLLDRFGQYGREYVVTRGNHDRAHSGEKWAKCRPAGVEGYDDCMRDAFFGSGPSYFSMQHRGVHLVGLDTCDLVTGEGNIDEAQFGWLEADLARHSGTPTFVFGHHPVTQEASLTAVPPAIFTLEPSDARRLERTMASGAVVGVYSAHTHRNKRTAAPDLPGVPFIELGAVKEYPGGYALVRVHEGGYAVNFYKTRSDPSRAWSERSRGEYLGLYPYYTLGSLADRNFTVEADFSGLSSAPEPGPAPPPRPAPKPEPLPATGLDVATAIAGAAAATGVALAQARRTRE